MKYVQTFLLMLVLSIIPLATVGAQTTTVNNETQLLEALSNQDVDNIIIGGNIDTTQKINITRDVAIDGNNHTLTYKGTANVNEWHGIYILQVYKCSVTLKDIKLTGGNAALLVNGGTVTLEGVIDVSGNTFGGIELGQGVNVNEVPHLDIDQDADIVNSTESEDKPTLWVPSDTPKAIVEHDGVMQTLNAGEELGIDEVLDLFGTPENPQTGDPIGYTLMMGLASLGGLIYSSKKLRNLN